MLKKVTHIISLFIALTLNANDVSELLKKAEQSYKQKNYTQTIELYHQVLNQNYYSPEIYYNLANAYFKNNQLGKAILYYEKAKKINTSDEDINHNLQLAYSKTIDKIETKDNFFIEVTKNNFLSKINTNSMAYISITMSALSLIFFAIFLFRSDYKKLFLILTALFTATAFTTYFTGYIAQKNNQSSNFGIIIDKQTKVTNEPLPDAVSKFSLHEGTKVKILQKSDNYLLIRLENGVEGWINEKSVELI